MVVDMFFDGCVGLRNLSRQIRETRFDESRGKLAARRKPQLRERFERIQELYTCLHSNCNTGNGCVSSLSFC
jgi:hypothetical protein